MAETGRTLGYCVTRNCIICTGLMVLLGQRNKEGIQNFGGETTWNIKKKVTG